MQSNRLMRSSTDVTTAERAFNPFSFAQRHIGIQADDMRRMLQVVGAPSLEALIDEAIPDDIRQTRPLSFGPAWTTCNINHEVRQLRRITAAKEARGERTAVWPAGAFGLPPPEKGSCRKAVKRVPRGSFSLLTGHFPPLDG